MKKNILSAIIVALAFLPAQLSAQQSRTQKIINAALKGWNIELRAGYNLGGTSPIPLPVEIREIKSYKPSMGFSVESDFTKFFDEKWGLLVGVKLENKNMETDARVKNYGMEILSEGAIASGRWTGGVKTSVRNAFLSFPVQAAYKVHPRTNLKLGVFLSYLIEGKFDGFVYDGYLRNGDPTGEKAVFTGDATATYDFSDELRKFQWGLQAGVDWEAFKHLKLYADLSWGLNSAFPESFKTITFSMYPIYFNVGVGYLF